jgi:hypothetical protein
MHVVTPQSGAHEELSSPCCSTQLHAEIHCPPFARGFPLHHTYRRPSLWSTRAPHRSSGCRARLSTQRHSCRPHELDQRARPQRHPPQIQKLSLRRLSQRRAVTGYHPLIQELVNSKLLVCKPARGIMPFIPYIIGEAWLRLAALRAVHSKRLLARPQPSTTAFGRQYPRGN